MVNKSFNYVFRLLPGADLRLSIEDFVKKIILKLAGWLVVLEASRLILYDLQINPKLQVELVILKS